jgi:putative glutamine amidotransferase
MRVVLVSQRLVACDGYDEVRECLDRRWGSFFHALDLLPVALPSAIDVHTYLSCLNPVGIVLSGGNDLSSVGGGDLSRQRDAFELSVIEAARERALPLIGVCRGMQLLAERAGYAIEPCPGHVGTDHEFLPAEPTRHGALGQIQTGNSFHAYAVRAPLRSEYRVALRAQDGVAEAIEHETLRSIGIMWHPERYPAPRAADLELFRQVLLA